jgi:hypothetical protein
MKKIMVVLAFLFAVVSLAAAVAKVPQPKTYQDATVLSVNQHEDSHMVGGDNPTDAPLADPETFTYDISVRVNCGTYVGRYENWYDYVPAELSPNQKIQVHLTRSVMYVPIPNQNEVEMPIISKHVERGPCESTRMSAKR